MRSRSSFQHIRRHGTRARAGAVSVTFAPLPGEQIAQVGYAISRRVGNAVVRNRLRRRLRGALTELAQRDGSTLRAGLYLITTAPGADQLSYAELSKGLRSALGKVMGRSETAGAPA